MRAWIAALGCVVACSSTSRGVAKTQAAGPSHVEGTVVDTDGNTVADVVVSLRRRDSATTTRTDAHGAFVFTDVPPGLYLLDGRDGDHFVDGGVIQVPGTTHPYTLRRSHGVTVALHVIDEAGAPIPSARVGDAETNAAGLVELQGQRWRRPFHVRIDADGFVSQDVTAPLARDPGGRVDWTVTLARGAPVRGLVRDPDGVPVADARVKIEGCGNTSATTDADGLWVLRVTAGTCVITADVERVGRGATRPLAFDGTTRTDSVKIAVERGSAILGTVVDEHDAPVGFAEILLDGDPWPVSFADASGQFAVRGLRRAPHRIRASLGDRGSRELEVDLTDGDVDALRVVTAPSLLHGVVVDDRAVPVAGASVRVGRPGRPGMWQDVITDAAGGFHVGGMAPGEYDVTAGLPGIERHERARTPDASSRTDGPPLRIVLRDPGTITGTVTRDGRPVEHYAFAIMERRSMLFHAIPQVVTSGEGTFTRELVRGGTWTLAVFGDGFPPTKIDGVEVNPGEVTDLGTIEVDRGVQIHGQVVDSVGHPIAGAAVGLGWMAPDLEIAARERWAVDGGRVVATGHDGRFTIDGVARQANRWLTAAHPSFGRAEPVHPPADGSPVILTVGSLGAIEGTIEGLPSRMDRVSIEVTRDGVYERAHASEDGWFRIDGLVPGTYRVLAGDVITTYAELGVVDVKAGATARVAYMFPAVIAVSVQVGRRDCRKVTLLRADRYASAACEGDRHVNLGDVLPGDYELCIDRRCREITITPTPAWQLLGLSP